VIGGWALALSPRSAYDRSARIAFDTVDWGRAVSGRTFVPAAVFLCALSTGLAGCHDSTPATPTPPRGTCDYSVSPPELTEHWHGTGFSLTITTSAGCGWTASPSEPWIRLDRSSGDGPASVGVSYGVFTEDATRRAAVQVRWPTATAGQNVWVTQEGCRYGFDETAASFPAAGGTRMVTVVTQALSASCSIGCPWTATSSVAWIRITSSMPRAGDDRFSYEVDANAGSARVGTITVAGRTQTVNQAGL
jgi:hypothetical protein